MATEQRTGEDQSESLRIVPPTNEKKSLAARLEQLHDLYAPYVEQPDGTRRRDPAYGVISQADFMRLMDFPDVEQRPASARRTLQQFQNDLSEVRAEKPCPPELRGVTSPSFNTHEEAKAWTAGYLSGVRASASDRQTSQSFQKDTNEVKDPTWALPWPVWARINDALTPAGVCSIRNYALSGEVPASMAYILKLAAQELRQHRERADAPPPPRCDHYWNEHQNRCVLPSGHAGQHGYEMAHAPDPRRESPSSNSQSFQKVTNEVKADGDAALEFLSDFGKVYEDSGREGYDLCTTDVADLIGKVRERAHRGGWLAAMRHVQKHGQLSPAENAASPNASSAQVTVCIYGSCQASRVGISLYCAKHLAAKEKNEAAERRGSADRPSVDKDAETRAMSDLAAEWLRERPWSGDAQDVRNAHAVDLLKRWEARRAGLSSCADQPPVGLTLEERASLEVTGALPLTLRSEAGRLRKTLESVLVLLKQNRATMALNAVEAALAWEER